jgi:hypothetical protein
MEEVLWSYTPLLPPFSAKSSKISAQVKQPTPPPPPSPPPPLVAPPLPPLPPESYYPKTPPVPSPVVPVTAPVKTVSLRPKPFAPQGRKICRAYWAMLPWDSAIDGHMVSKISGLYRLMFLRHRKKPEAGKLFPVRLTTCSVITRSKATVYKTAPPSNVAAQIPNTAHFIHIRTSNGSAGLGDVRVYLNNVLLLSFFDSYGVNDLGFTSGGAPIYPPPPYNYITTFAESLVKKTRNIIRLEMDNQTGGSPYHIWADVYGYPKVAGAVVVAAMNILLPIEYRDSAPAILYKTEWSFNK